MVATATSCEGSPFPISCQLCTCLLYIRPTDLVLGQYPTQGPDTGRCANDAMQSDLSNLDQFYRSIGDVDDVVVQDVIMSIHK
jgi:hypothetical protein